MPSEPFSSLTSETDWSEALERSTQRPVLIFKHSSACPVSGKAQRNMKKLGTNSDVPIYKVVVQESRPVSDEIADTLDLRHETPQAILLHEKEPVFEASHFDVTVDALQEALQDVSASN